MTCQDDQLCAGLEAGINGAVQGIQDIWGKNSTTEDWGFLLVGTKNVSDDINRFIMLWMFRQSWPSGAWFVFIFYCHWSLLVLWNSNGTASFLHSKEGATQGDTLAMIAYGIGILPLINNLNPEIPDVTQPWCADDARALSTFSRIETYIDVLRCQGPRCRYYTKPSKNVLIVHTKDIMAGKKFWVRHGFKMCKGAHYFGGYIGDDKYTSSWLREHTLMWEKFFSVISETMGK